MKYGVRYFEPMAMWKNLPETCQSDQQRQTQVAKQAATSAHKCAQVRITSHNLAQDRTRSGALRSRALRSRALRSIVGVFHGVSLALVHQPEGRDYTYPYVVSIVSFYVSMVFHSHLLTPRRRFCTYPYVVSIASWYVMTFGAATLLRECELVPCPAVSPDGSPSCQ